MAIRDWFWVIVLGAVWGCSFLFNAVLIREIGPLWVSATRVTIGALGCWAIFIALRKPLPSEPMLYLQFLLFGILTYAVPFALFPLSQQHLASGVAAIINALTPITTVIVSRCLGGGGGASWGEAVGRTLGWPTRPVCIS